MLLVFASERDLSARRLIEAWGARDARLVTPRDLSTAGWCHYVNAPGSDVAVIGGQRIAADQVAGVLTRLPAVWAQDRAHIVEGDRRYVAAEMTAFMTAWLARVPRPVVNRPTPTSLMGPGWSTERWFGAAARAGLRLATARRRYPPDASPSDASPPGATVTVVGERCVGAADASLYAQALCLARAADADLLDVRFSAPGPEACFVGVQLWPDVAQAEVADALAALFDRGGLA